MRPSCFAGYWLLDHHGDGAGFYEINMANFHTGSSDREYVIASGRPGVSVIVIPPSSTTAADPIHSSEEH